MISANKLHFFFIIAINIGLSGKTSAEFNASLKFFAVGDWGGIPFWPYKTPTQIAVSEKMSSMAQQLKVDFILSLGDHFYSKGVTCCDDPRFKTTYEDVFNSTTLGIPWYIAAGNHDYYGNITAQLAYSKISKRWNFPYYYYKKSFTIPESSATVDLVVIDTVLLCGGTDENHPENQPILENKDLFTSEQHWVWLEKTLKSSNATFLIVGGHYPVYSIGWHGSTHCLQKRLSSLLQKYQVNAYFSGHDHNLQHIQPNSTTSQVNYFVSGATNVVDESTKHIHDVPPEYLKFHWAELLSLGALCYVEIIEKEMTVMFIKSSDSVLYKYTLSPRK